MELLIFFESFLKSFLNLDIIEEEKFQAKISIMSKFFLTNFL